MGHLPVRDVHLLVISWWKRENYRIPAGKHPVGVCLHHLREVKGIDFFRILSFLDFFLYEHNSVDSLNHLVDGDEAFRVHVDAALLQEACCRNTSCRRDR